MEVYNFPGSILETAGVDRPVPPFAIVGSKDMLEGETFWPVRRYKWGTCEAANYEHSDFQLLKCAPAQLSELVGVYPTSRVQGDPSPCLMRCMAAVALTCLHREREAHMALHTPGHTFFMTGTCC